MFTKLVKIFFSNSAPDSNFTSANTKSILFSDEKGEPNKWLLVNGAINRFTRNKFK